MADSNAADSSTLAVEKRLGEISKKIAAEAKILLIVGLVILAVMTGWFVYGLGKITSQLEAKQVVLAGDTYISQQLPIFREEIQKQLIDGAPSWARKLSQQAIDAAPSAREKLEDQIVDRTMTTIEEYIQIGDKEFKAVLEANRTSFEETLEALATDEDFSDETVKIFTDALNEQLGQDMHEQAEQVFGTLVALREKAEKLSAGKSLTKEERVERDSLRLFRRLQLNEADVKRARAEEKEAAEKARKVAEERAKQAEGEEGDEKPSDEKPADEKPKDESEASAKEESGN
jgi:hypothetical protein